MFVEPCAVLVEANTGGRRVTYRREGHFFCADSDETLSVCNTNRTQKAKNFVNMSKQKKLEAKVAQRQAAVVWIR